MRLLALVAGTLVCCVTAPTAARPAEPDKDQQLAARVRELEERLARLEKQLAAPKIDAIPFGEVVVNLKDDRSQRYLRVGITFRVSPAAHRELTALVTAKRAELKNWLITYLSDQTVMSVSGSKGVARVRDDMQRELGKILQQDRKANPIIEVLFEEYVVQ